MCPSRFIRLNSAFPRTSLGTAPRHGLVVLFLLRWVWWIWLADFLCHARHIHTLLGEVPEHLDELVGEGVEVDVELAICWANVSLIVYL